MTHNVCKSFFEGGGTVYYMDLIQYVYTYVKFCFVITIF